MMCIIDFSAWLAYFADEPTAAASRLSLEHKLPMADSIILATANQYKAVIWTQDVDFKGLPGVNYFKK